MITREHLLKILSDDSEHSKFIYDYVFNKIHNIENKLENFVLNKTDASHHLIYVFISILKKKLKNFSELEKFVNYNMENNLIDFEAMLHAKHGNLSNFLTVKDPVYLDIIKSLMELKESKSRGNWGSSEFVFVVFSECEKSNKGIGDLIFRNKYIEVKASKIINNPDKGKGRSGGRITSRFQPKANFVKSEILDLIKEYYNIDIATFNFSQNGIKFLNQHNCKNAFEFVKKVFLIMHPRAHNIISETILNYLSSTSVKNNKILGEKINDNFFFNLFCMNFLYSKILEKFNYIMFINISNLNFIFAENLNDIINNRHHFIITKGVNLDDSQNVTSVQVFNI